jgi:TRAP-type mannitol/chloroaromatic compound transport system substrate-binding protein
MLNRKSFFKALALGTISLPFAIRAFSKGEGEQESQGPNIITKRKYRWKMVTTWPPNFPVLGEGANLFAQWVKEMSNDRLEIRVYGGGELVPALQAFDAVSSGAAQAGSGVAYYWAGKAPAAQFFAAVPFGMNAQQVNAWINHGGGMELWKELYGQFGLVPMLGGNTGVQMGGWFNREINSIGDFQGLKMRIPGLGGRVLEKAGGAPVLLAGGEIYTGLERGVIDATEWIGPYHDYMMGFYQIAKYYYAPGWHEPGPALELIFNKKALEELPSDLQAIVRSAAARLNMWVLSEFEAKNVIYLKKLMEEEAVDVRLFPKEVLDQLRVYSAEVIEEVVSGDPFARKVYDAYRSFRKSMVTWSNYTEKAFYENIQLG